jgi:hypothetical protein
MKKVEPLPFRTHLACVVGVVMLVSPLLAEPHTQAIATQVAAQLDAQMLDAFAAEDPNDAGRFIAAIYVGEHILAISAVHPAPASVRQDIAAGNYRQVYSVLSTSANKEGRLFVTDFGAPGLRPTRKPNESFDITWRDSTHQTTFDGNWRTQNLSEAEYRDRFAADERQYAQMLQVLDVALQDRTGVQVTRSASAPASAH